MRKYLSHQDRIKNVARFEESNERQNKRLAKNIYGKNKPEKAQLEKMQALISIARVDEMAEIINFSNQSQIISKTANSNFRRNEVLENEYGKLKDFTIAMANLVSPPNNAKTQTGSELIRQVISFDKTIQYRYLPSRMQGSISNVVQSYEYFKGAMEGGSGALVFDFETLGGNKKTGAKAFDAITEFGYTVMHNDTTFEESQQGMQKYLVGIDDNLYKKYMDMLEKGKFDGTDDYVSVLADRLALYGHKDTVIDKSQGAWKITKMGEYGKHESYTQEDIKKGIQLLKQAHDADLKTFNQGRGLTQTQAARLEMYKLMANSKMPIVGYNSTRSDILWNELDFYNLPEQVQEVFKKELGLNPSQNFFEIAQERHFDVFKLLKAAQQGSSISSVYLNSTNIDAGASALAQETLGKTLFPDIMKGQAAHGVGADVGILTQIANHKVLLENAYTTVKKMETEAAGHEMTLNRGTQLFMATQSDTNGSALDFLMEPNGQIRLRSGYTITKEGTMIGDHNRQKMFHKNSLYTIEGSGVINPTKEVRESIGKINTDYALDRLYYLDIKGYAPSKAGKTGNLDSLSIRRLFFNSQEQVETFMQSFLLIGEQDSPDGGFKPLSKDKYGDYAEKVAKQLEIIDLTKPSKLEEQTFDNLIDNALNSEMTDRAEHAIRTSNYTKMKYMQNMATVIQNDTGLSKDVKPQGLVAKMQGEDLSFAVKVSKGEHIQLKDMNYQKIVNAIGFEDVGEKRVYNQTIDNIIGLSEYYYNNNLIIDNVLETVDSMHLKTKAQKQYAYGYLMDSVANTMAEEHLKKGSTSKPLKLARKDTHYIEVKEEIFNSRKNVRKFISNEAQLSDKDLIRINTTGKNAHYNLIDDLIIAKYGEIPQREADKTAQAFTVLEMFKEHMGSVSGFKKELRGIKNFSDYSSPEVMASDIIQALENVKEKNPLAGILKKTVTPSVNNIAQNGNQLVETMGGVENLQAILKAASKHMPKQVVLNKDNIEKMSKDVTNAMFDVPILSKNKALKYAQKQGLIGNQAKYWANLYEQSVYDYRTMITDMVKNLTDIEGVTFEFDQKSRRMFIRNGGKALEITQQLPKLKLSGPLMSLELGKMNLNLHGVITGNSNHYDSGSIRYETNIKKAFDEGMFSFKKVAKTSNQRGNPLTHISAALTQFGNSLRSVSNIDSENIQKQLSNNVIDVRYVYRAAVQLDMEGQLENIPGIKKDLIKAVRKFRGDKAIDELDFDNLSASYTENIHQNLQAIMHKLTKNKAKVDDTLGTAVKVMTPQASQNNVSIGFMGTGAMTFAHGNQAKGSRITQFQNNFYKFFKSESTVSAAKAFTGEDLSYREAKKVLEQMGISVGSKINNPHTFKLDNFKSLDQSVSYQITTNKVLVSDNNFHEIIKKHVYSKKQTKELSNYTEEQLQKILEKINSVSLLEDETLVNPKLFDSFFTKQKYTIIDEDKLSSAIKKGKEDEFKELSKTMYQVVQQPDGTYQIKYGKSLKKKTSEKLFDVKGYKDSTDIKLASYDGYLKYGFIDKTNGIVLSEKQINKRISNIKDVNKVKKILDGIDTSFYFERDYDERYRKIMVSNVEKSKGSQLIFDIGEYDTQLKEEIAKYISPKSGRINKETSNKDIDAVLNQIKQKLTGKKSKKTEEEVDTILKNLERRIKKERYTVWNFIEEAFTWQTGMKEAIGMFTNENIPKHEGSSQLINENIADLIDIQRTHFGLGKTQAAQKVIDQLKGIVPTFKDGQYTVHSDGSIVVNDTPDIDSHFYIQKLKELKESKEYEGLFGEGSLLGRKLIEDDKGNTLAVITKTTLSETEEYNIPGANMPIEYVKTMQDYESSKQIKKSEIHKVKEEIKEVQQTYNTLSKEDKEEADKIIRSKKKIMREAQKELGEINQEALVYRKAYKEQFKGMSTSEREFLALNNYKYDQGELELLKSRLHNKFGDDELFNHYFSEVLDADGNISTKVKGKSMFANYIQGIRRSGIEQTDFGELLDKNNYKKKINKVFKNKDEHIREGIKEAFEVVREKSGFEKVSIESLEDIYFLNQSLKANEFNTLSVKTEGSTEKMLKNGFEKIHIDDMQFAMDDDIDVIEKLGKSVYSKNLLVDIGDGNLVASPYMPHSQFGGSVVQKEYQSQFRLIAKSRQEMAEAKKLGDEEAFEKAQKEYAKYTSTLVSDIRDTTLGKEGVLKDRFKVRLDQSFRAKTSTAFERYQGFDKAMFDGKTIREWMDKGVYLDVAFGNQKMFEDMGFFTDKHLGKFTNMDFAINGEVVSKKGEAVTRDMMVRKLETEGIDNITTRYPTNMLGSLTPGKLYLDSSIKNSENKVKLAYWTQLAKNGDNDGDDLYGAVMKYYNPKKRTYRDSMQTTTREGTDAAMMLRANTTNVYYANAAKQKTEAETAIKNNFDEFIKKRTLQGQKVPEYFGNILEDYSQDQIDEYANTLSDIESKMGSKIDISNYSNINKFLDTVSDKTQKETYKKAIAFKDSVENQLLSMVAKTRKKSIGETDNLSYLLRREGAELAAVGNISQKELQSVNAISFLVTENIISSKNAADIENPNIVDDFREIINDAHYGKIDEKKVTTFLDKQVKSGFKSGESVMFAGRYANELEKSVEAMGEANMSESSIEKLTKEKMKSLEEINYEEAKKDFFGFLGQLNTDEMRNIKQATNIGTKVAITENTVLKGANGISENIISNKDFIMNMAMNMKGSDFSAIDPSALASAKRSVESAEVNMGKLAGEVEEFAIKKQMAANAIPKISSRSLAGVAIGLATAYMVTGFMGSNPSTPSTTQAHKQAKEEEEEYAPQYTLSDYGSDYKYESTNKGYVINIKSKGNDKDVQKAVNSISQSISSSVNVNSNVNVNLKIQELSEIDNRKINRMVSDALNI